MSIPHLILIYCKQSYDRGDVFATSNSEFQRICDSLVEKGLIKEILGIGGNNRGFTLTEAGIQHEFTGNIVIS